MQFASTIPIQAAIFLAALGGTAVYAVPATETPMVVRWNTIALQTTSTAAFNPLQESRSLALASAAVFDAVNSITSEFEPFALRLRAPADASPAAATAAAAHAVLTALYPGQKTALDAEYAAMLTELPAGPGRQHGVDLGRAAAAAMLALRASDRADIPVEYHSTAEPGAWVPTPPSFAAPLGPGWGRVAPFTLRTGAQFRPEPPPAPDSPAYLNDLREITVMGIERSSQRTAKQTGIARMWIATAPQLWNQAVQELTVEQTLSPTAAARAFLLLNIAGADALIAAWDAKFTYSQWRPVTAIRSATGSTGTADPAWTPLATTPPFPDYPAGHTAYAGAAEIVLTWLFGETPGKFTIASATEDSIPHTYQCFADVAEDVVNARVWCGVHWRTSCVAGRKLGQQVGRWALTSAPSARPPVAKVTGN